MSTRSGKRIHSSFHENTVEPVVIDEVKIQKPDRKTRSKRLKENEDHSEVTESKLKKRHNYVSYPTDDEQDNKTVTIDASEIKTRKVKRQTLKEQNVNIVNSNPSEVTTNAKKRITRHTRKFPDNPEEDIPNATITKETDPEKPKSKKNKRKRSRNSDVNDNIEAPQHEVVTKAETKKSKKKKKGKHAKTSTENVRSKDNLNGSKTSMESFHSAAGSPMELFEEDVTSPKAKKNITAVDVTDSKTVAKLNDTFEKEESENEQKTAGSPTQAIDAGNKTKSKKTKKLAAVTKEIDAEAVLDETFDKTKSPNKSRKSSIKNTTFDKDDSEAVKELNSTFNKSNETQLNTTFDKDQKSNRSLRLSISNGDIKNSSLKLNRTFDKTDSKQISLDTTFDKSEPKLNSTFDKKETKNASVTSSIITSDEGTINVTFDKDDNSRISITSDESKTENIVNTTPVLIESSLDESQLSKSRLSVLNSTKDASTERVTLIPVVTLTREGTFTKETEADPELLTERTPTKKLSMPSPGNTPFHTSRSSQKMLNVTRSIEKSTVRLSLAEVAPRQTRVMFCSPVNNPAAIQLMKKKVIKSSLKGSNKSFVFEDSAPTARPSSRKRSFTHDAAESSRAKRTRLDDVGKPPRTRTVSAAAKLPDTTPAKKQTPSKSKSDVKRTKLPNFAALHQKQFSRMESLDECQERKAKRARQLLTPNGALKVLERSSPRGADQTKGKESVKKLETPAKMPETPAKMPETPAKKPETPAKKPQTPAKQDTPKLHKMLTLETLQQQQQGYTRFGFKMNTNINPFSIPSKNVEKSVSKTKQNGFSTVKKAPKSIVPTSELPKRMPMQPSLTGTTRKEAAKQTVMREKSFTSLSGKRDVKRSESRTVIKGVRTNRRFELQMQMRNVD